MVKVQLPLIEEAIAENWWADVTLAMVENLRHNLRDLMQFIDPTETNIIDTNFQEELIDISEATVPTEQMGFSPYQYRKKVETYIRNHQDHVAIAKLRRNLPLTDTDLNSLEAILFTTEGLENKERFKEVFKTQATSLKSFIRSLVGLDRAAAKTAFSQYLENTEFTANQIRFIEQIIDLLTQQGVMDPASYTNHPLPICILKDLMDSLRILFENNDADNIVSIIRSFNDSVDMKFGLI